jgi:hypothetical protein
MASVLNTVETLLTPAVSSVTQTSTQAQQAMTDIEAQAAEAKTAVVGYGATTVVLQAIIAGGVIVAAYQLWKLNQKQGRR